MRKGYKALLERTVRERERDGRPWLRREWDGREEKCEHIKFIVDEMIRVVVSAVRCTSSS